MLWEPRALFGRLECCALLISVFNRQDRKAVGLGIGCKYKGKKDHDGTRLENIFMEVGTNNIEMYILSLFRFSNRSSYDEERYSNILEWMCIERQQKMYLLDNLMP
ncbi:hypothetical protein RCL_jg16338.t1 [Rhizophagus clarus]|uniref:Uncharacterized protein n=1 Tax=Rhizophagus clarus TaxID=94130 RepID=A0A8H3QZE6_9GLOM|nr:hypothetical protein RCL_jg16338.t1 [Rhizophagus clarus]